MDHIIIATHTYYGGAPDQRRPLCDDQGGIWRGTAEEAAKRIAWLDSLKYWQEHNEAGRPDYRAVPEGSREAQALL